MSPLLGRLGALGIDNRSTRARLSPSRLADRDIKRLVDALQRAIPIPQLKIEMRRALRRQIFWQSLPLAAGREHIEDCVEDLALVDRPPSSATPRWWNERSDQPPLGIAQVARITNTAAVIGKAMFRLPHAVLHCEPCHSQWNHNRLIRLKKFLDRLSRKIVTINHNQNYIV